MQPAWLVVVGLTGRARYAEGHEGLVLYYKGMSDGCDFHQHAVVVWSVVWSSPAM